MTTDNLFDIPESPSPRIQWMRDHLIAIIPMAHQADAPSLPKFIATKTVIGTGDTEDAAFDDLLEKVQCGLNLKLWNE
jgi:hypothetical protein